MRPAIFIQALLFAACGLTAAERTMFRQEDDSAALHRQWQGRFEVMTAPETPGGKPFLRFDNIRDALCSTGFIPVTAGKQYVLSGFFRSTGNLFSSFYFGVIPYDAEKRVISAYEADTVPDTGTVLAAPALSGSHEILVRDARLWRSERRGVPVVVFNAKPDFSDLPNFGFRSQFKNVLPEAGAYRVELMKPLDRDYPAGTGVRLHDGAFGANLYAAATDKAIPHIWQEYRAVLDFARAPERGMTLLRPGTAYVRILVLPNYAVVKNSTVSMDMAGVVLREADKIPPEQQVDSMNFDRLPVYYTGKIFPKPKQVKYAERTLPLGTVAIETGRTFPGDDYKVRFLKHRLESLGAKVELFSSGTAVGNHDAVIKLNAGGGVPAPAKPQGYSVAFSGNTAAVNSHDSSGLLWGIVSLLQMTEKKNGSAVIHCFETADYPSMEIRGALSPGWPEHAAGFMLFTKMNSIVFQTSETNEPFLRHSRRDPQKVDQIEFYGRVARDLGLNVFFTVNAGRLFTNHYAKDVEPLRCGSEEDFKFVYDIAALYAKNGCGVYLAFDDLRFPVHPDDLKQFGSARKADVYFVNKLHRTLKKEYPGVKMIFCPPFYWGPGSYAPYPEPRTDYLRALGEELDPEIELFWTGPSVGFDKIKPDDIRWFTDLTKRKPLLFTNGSGTKHPYEYTFVTDPISEWNTHFYNGFSRDMRGIFPNTSGAHDATYIATSADYSWNEEGYAPEDSIRTIVGLFFGPGSFEVFDRLNKAQSCFDQFGLRSSPNAARKLPEMQRNYKALRDAYAEAARYNQFALNNLSGMERYLMQIEFFIRGLGNDPKLKTYADADAKVRRAAMSETGSGPESVVLAPNDFSGGMGPENYEGKLITWIYGARTEKHALVSSFECVPFPVSGDYKLVISGQDADSVQKSVVEIRVNDRVIFSGADQFPSGSWKRAEFRIPADCLQRSNRLQVRNLANSADSEGPPYFMLSYAVLKPSGK